MIPEKAKNEIISTGIHFMRSITKAYGTDVGLKLWETIASTLDPDIKGQIFFALLVGNFEDTIVISGVAPTAGKINVIKQIRKEAGMSLKEAKDLADALFIGRSIEFKIEPSNYTVATANLRRVGCYV